MQLSLYNGTQMIATLNVDDACISNFKIGKGTCLHIDDDPTTFFKKKIEAMKVGDRCLVSINGIEHYASIRYIGGFHRKSGTNIFYYLFYICPTTYALFHVFICYQHFYIIYRHPCGCCWVLLYLIIDHQNMTTNLLY